MPALFATDSKGNQQYILKQEFNTSCGPASVAMAEDAYKQKCMLDPEGRARQLSQKYPGKWTITGGTSDMENLTDVLNAEEVKSYRATFVGPGSVYQYLAAYAKELTPVVVRIQWTKGGHFVVCKQIYPDGTIVFLDPWYGLVEVAAASLPAYTPPGASGQTSGHLVVTHR